MNVVARRSGQLALAAFFHPTGHHVASWLHPESQIDAGTNFRHYVQLAQTAERAKFDFIFLADAVAVRHGNLNALRRWPQYMAYFEPITLLSALAAVTEHIGLVSTATTSYNELVSNGDEVSGTGYTTGGATLTRIDPVISGGVVILDFPDASWPTALAIQARGALIYNDSAAGKNALRLNDFGQTLVADPVGGFSAQFPAPNAASAIIRWAAA